ncbi:M20 family metallopeptidase [Bythopirellula goksoeyrii]|uniref:Acetylornithine deacetylase n=1 Tax=Bythopirellula goksoeyrii TaxID=1400387 RepID=A0A5B9Q7X8_9BACT|nr:M20/M25/M40 family metallo-hydrolase [Bythopirellula goksoeyrii]QEG35144.1 Acetylornithine deacetylase [Bythopirellula goksoeyrii]
MRSDSQRLTRVTELLSSLVSLDSINPMGRPYSRSQPVERESIEFIEKLFAPYRNKVSLQRQTCSAFHENLIICFGDTQGCPVGLFESHIDTVPADDWRDRALVPVVEDGCLIGRGACDDKGSLAAMILALLEILEAGAEPPIPIVLLCAGDEENAQTGIRHFVENSHPDLAYAIFGEPTRLSPVVQHKGTIRWDIVVHGTSAHTCRPELGTNAILGMTEVVSALQTYQNRLQATYRSRYMTGPTITVTMIEGGRTRNATADECKAAIDFRILPNMDPAREFETLVEYLETLEWQISHSPLQLMTPALSTDPKLPFCQDLLEICHENVSSRVALRGEPYGTDAAWVSNLCPAVVLGPGDISFAHAIDERVALSEVAQAVEVYKQIMLHSFKSGFEESQVVIPNNLSDSVSDTMNSANL